eukprot:TRINITY_DN30696_c0_g1_i1.p1 TRINITY_DN30696_c0_g1~~TRINITY_DN30696_c0_g1_i1.p1  ORF type:complete len:286 (+),score=77.23 TRINITY_DN30696_c0_g1_i1:83-940(+)
MLTSLIRGCVRARGRRWCSGTAPPPAFEPVNDLERSLLKGRTELHHRPQFYRDLMDAHVFVLRVVQEGDNVANGARVAEKDETFQSPSLMFNDKPYVPIFTSLPRLEAIAQPGMRYIQLEARTLFEGLRGAEFLINPGSSCVKELSKPEVEALLSGSFGSTDTISKGTTVLLSQPESVPESLEAALRSFFAKTSTVKRAFFAKSQVGDAGAKPELMVAIDFIDPTGPGRQEVINDAIVVVRGVGPVLPDGWDICMLGLEPGCGVEEHFEAVTPFYTADDAKASSA